VRITAPDARDRRPQLGGLLPTLRGFARATSAQTLPLPRFPIMAIDIALKWGAPMVRYTSLGRHPRSAGPARRDHQLFRRVGEFGNDQSSRTDRGFGARAGATEIVVTATSVGMHTNESRSRFKRTAVGA